MNYEVIYNTVFHRLTKLNELPNCVSQKLRKEYTNDALRRLYVLYCRLGEFFEDGVDAGVMPAIASVCRLKWMEKFHKR